MPSKLPRFTIRAEQEIIDKMNLIAAEHQRSTTQEIVYIIKQYIKDYEKENGEIEIKQINIENISHSGSGNINIK